jgi:hypothetical protein
MIDLTQGSIAAQALTPETPLGAVRAVELVEFSELEISRLERECHDQVAGNSDAAVPLSISHTRRFTSWLRSQPRKRA